MGDSIESEIPAPVAVWDTGEGWTDGPYLARASWCRQHGIDPNITFRLEFYSIDSPFVVVHQFLTNDAGKKIKLGNGIYHRIPFIVDLPALPHRNIL